MYRDEIVEEIHRIREEYSQSFNHDFRALFADLQRQQLESGRKILVLSKSPVAVTRWGKPVHSPRD